MKLINIPLEFLKAEKVIQSLQKNGFEAYFVGGSVRDVLLGKQIHDVDIATSAYPEEIKSIFSRTVDIGIEHGTVLVLDGEEQYEVTTFRTEATYQDFRRPDKVTFVRSLKEDLKRRDFTINALAMNIDGEIIDLFDGITDLNNRLIRAVGDPKERFHEDALRMMRCVRLASQLDFFIEEKTLSAIADFHVLLDKISVERKTVEFEKMLLGENRCAGVDPFIETECYQYCPGLRKYGSALFRFNDLPNKQIQRIDQAWTLLLHCLNITEEAIPVFLKQWKLSNQLIRSIQCLSSGLKKRLMNDWDLLDAYYLGIENILLVENLLFYYGKKSKIKEAHKLFDQLPIHERSQLKVTGNDLLEKFERKPGKWIGITIELIEIAVITGLVSNEREALLSYVEKKLLKELEK